MILKKKKSGNKKVITVFRSGAGIVALGLERRNQQSGWTKVSVLVLSGCYKKYHRLGNR